MRINENTLPRLLFGGMLALVLILTLSLGGYNTVVIFQAKHAEIERIQKEEMQRHESMLRAEVAAVRDFVNFTRSRTESVLKANIKAQTDQAYQVAHAIWQREHGKRPDREIKQLIIEALRPVRFFEGRGYVFIDDTDGKCILLPTAPRLEGTSLWDNRDDTGHYIMRGLVAATDNPDRAGYSNYRWYSPDSPREMQDKIAYVRKFAPYDWIIGTGEYLYKVEQDLQLEALARVKDRRFGKDGYIAVVQRQPDDDVRILANPTSPNVGRLISTLPPDSIEPKLVREFADKVRHGEYFSEYRWLHPHQGGHQRKLSLVSETERWGWILIAGLYLDDLDALVSQRQHEAELTAWEGIHVTLGIGIASLCLALLFAAFYTRWMSRLLHRYRQDIDAQHALLIQHAEAQKLAACVFESSQEAIFITDAESRIIDVNPAFEQLTGYTRDEVVGETPKILSSGRQDADFYTTMRTAIENHGSWSGEIWNRRKDGQIYPEWQSITAIRDESGQITHFIATFTDISERKENEARLRHMAEYDALTGLPNRHLLSDRATQALASAERSGHHVALMFMDLDRFKNINDSLGHAVGDQLLISIAERLRHAVRNADTVSRIGGDEFIILLPDLEHPGDAARVATKLLAKISQPVLINEVPIEVTPSIGVALYPDDGHDVSVLMKNADTAMYHAKAEGRNNYQFFTAELNARTQARFTRENQLRQAVDRGELFLVYQPQVSLRDGEIVGCEALLRWQHPEHGVLPPSEFIEIAEESGSIEHIGTWVLFEACRQGKRWRDAGLPIRRMGVNVSPTQLNNPDFITIVRHTLRDTGYPAEGLELEITENLLVNQTNRLKDIFNELTDMGISLALDDFGTGYSNLAYLKQFPLHRLKIDRSFVSDIPNDVLDATLTTAIAGLAENFGLTTIAEGVETAEQRDFLIELGCDEAQGYFYYKPMRPEALEDLFPAFGR